jgi:peptidoglycan/LPS O-acetylase OafA/YrhL
MPHVKVNSAVLRAQAGLPHQDVAADNELEAEKILRVRSAGVQKTVPFIQDAEEALLPQNQPNTPASFPGRFPELDALRGLAATLVVFHHFQLVWNPSDAPSVSLAPHGSVPLFFLLSGFVLAIPFLKGKQQPYFRFVTRRVIRIYCPYLCALALSVAGAAIFHRHLGMEHWVDCTWSRPVSGILILQHAFLVGIFDSSQFNTAFWSLVQEMRISLIFPVLFFFINRMRTQLAMLTAVGFSLVHQWAAAHPRLDEPLLTFRYIPIFICGILLARNLGSLTAWYQKLGQVGYCILALGSVLLFSEGHLIQEAHIPGFWRLEDWPAVLGSAGLILVCLNSSRARSVLRSTVPKFMGRISYSLYLVHGTVLFTLVMLLHGKVSLGLFLVVYVVVSLLLATGFCVAVDEPTIKLGREIGELLRSRRIQHSTNSVRGDVGGPPAPLD